MLHIEPLSVLCSLEPRLVMGMEETHVCLDKESDFVSVTAYSNGDSDTSTDGNDAVHPERVGSFDQLGGNTDSQILEQNSDSNEYEVKECTMDNNAERAVESSEEQSILVKDVGNGLKEKLVDELPKGKSKSKERPVMRSSKNLTKSVRSSCTVPQPFTLATEKRASAGSAKNHDLKSSPTKDSKLRKIVSTFTSRKPMQAEYKKHPEEEDSSSVISSTAVSTETPKKKMPFSTPKFRCSERAEKRKEFNSKLEEKQLALEAERIQYEARTKEETEAAIKQLRKSLTFKATPLPIFYLNGLLPNNELRKLPATRPKSPKFGRRKSCSDAPSSFQDEKIKEARVQEHCASLGNHKGKMFASNGCYEKRGQATSLCKVE